MYPGTGELGAFGLAFVTCGLAYATGVYVEVVRQEGFVPMLVVVSGCLHVITGVAFLHSRDLLFAQMAAYYGVVVLGGSVLFFRPPQSTYHTMANGGDDPRGNSEDGEAAVRECFVIEENDARVEVDDAGSNYTHQTTAK